MKKISTWFIVLLLSGLVFLLGFNYKTSTSPHAYYQVYLDNELIGTIESKSELEDYINLRADKIRENVKNYNLKLDAIETYEKYESNVNNSNVTNLDKVKYLINNKDELKLSDIDVDNLKFYKKEKLYNLSSEDIKIMSDYVDKNEIYVYADEVFIPNGMQIKKVYTYNNELITVKEAYKKIVSKKSYTIAGYKFTIKSDTEGVDDLIIYTLDKDIFTDAVEDLIEIFVDEDDYEKYKSNNQTEITSTGTNIENIYVQQDITYKATNISTEEKIYTNSTDLSAYLLYGDNFTETTVKVKTGDSIESIAFDNQISVQEFLIFNPTYTSRDNLLVTGTDVVISKIDPKLQIVVETYEVTDKVTAYTTVEQYDESLSQGSTVVTQEGENGLERVSQNVKSINGEISYVDPVDKQVLKQSVPKLVSIGTKYIPSVGSTGSWGWPTNSGYTISSYFGYRVGEFHQGLDIAGTGYGSPAYAANNGTIVSMGYHYSYGYNILINHNNGYYTLYAHLSRFASGLSAGSTVARGQTIGYIGSTGNSTGPHLHFEIRTCPGYNCYINPLSMY